MIDNLRLCWMCGKTAWCEHREPLVEAAVLGRLTDAERAVAAPVSRKPPQRAVELVREIRRASHG